MDFCSWGYCRGVIPASHHRIAQALWDISPIFLMLRGACLATTAFPYAEIADNPRPSNPWQQDLFGAKLILKVMVSWKGPADYASAPDFINDSPEAKNGVSKFLYWIKMGPGWSSELEICGCILLDDEYNITGVIVWEFESAKAAEWSSAAGSGRLFFLGGGNPQYMDEYTPPFSKDCERAW
ncbi:hypothetical protein MKZ38_006882 [Zalerion maritima]|uniref:Uncharacterized protein n=1 Tax=Zalerion maritima TaxID=339359 RepID=A0AAD5RIE0_9PEZI|nr:hypothetical protein MKZ38_006882 [Zalerion maritima]